MSIRNLPNLLTIARTIAIVPIVALLLWSDPTARWIALLLYTAACLTDFLDGYIARRLSVETPFGRMLDPIADKVLVSGLIVMLVATGDAPVIPAIIIIFRELLVSGVREQLASRGVTLHVTQLAKWKTTVQMVSMGFLIPGSAGFSLFGLFTTLELGQALFWIAALLTAITGWSYVAAATRQIEGGAP
ncbi:MAG: CDP-diacylglycerol--glycerol-3-phosphate 3-phosphatidyltransferase [Alphaproteobacteria bacterium]|jgi:cardiolipin synthase (CMP-forming)|nr:CDP-diacylglycerol--glycerol-3-phosphate 3-phosphatidyltransferase [Rhodospirillaceae bacterium]MDG2481653.1 CDP-diacylglycerol--glycerol-3-phosphate 3-phosphatidyltransferase [Alphaproteobacteria bacterium]MBT6204842.1 CDP-diacylglycerol--glycerol-3-phosphate 3-phosphatidyltransferase [Rhodospirillaceae bacterium]MBT6510671.1 CDP-diacylglycerol--glycerol-3-phosphate 3-phosphatidyltransferase [Rhodospirillaceae bacterium]MBT7615352.1 CDP-diacylglycerol--glycerol-3-phosphate 3-phosphatidyltra